jgi:hypothetical protein
MWLAPPLLFFNTPVKYIVSSAVFSRTGRYRVFCHIITKTKNNFSNPKLLKTMKCFKNLMLLFTAILLASCAKEFISQEIAPEPVSVDDPHFVSSQQAAEIAGMFLSRESGSTRSLANALVETVRDERSRDVPVMYVVNYPEGGFVIASASKEYYPVLAFSDENSLDMETISKTGVSVWMEETKDAIRASEYLDADAKAQIRSQWLPYETNERSIGSMPQTRGDQEYWDRIGQLANLYGLSGWQDYMSLNEAYGYGYINLSAYQNLADLANSFGSPIQYTIVAVRQVYVTPPKGPLLTTAWNQNWPYNASCGPYGSPANPTLDSIPVNYPVGCVAVAMGQIMRYHQKPALVTSPTNHKYNWNNMAVSPTSSVPVLIRAIGVDVDMNYNPYSLGGSWSTLWNAMMAFSSYGYSEAALSFSHDAVRVRTNINANKPVMMSGTSGSVGHAWVCRWGKRSENQDGIFC